VAITAAMPVGLPVDRQSERLLATDDAEMRLRVDTLTTVDLRTRVIGLDDGRRWDGWPLFCRQEPREHPQVSL